MGSPNYPLHTCMTSWIFIYLLFVLFILFCSERCAIWIFYWMYPCCTVWFNVLIFIGSVQTIEPLEYNSTVYPGWNTWHSFVPFPSFVTPTTTCNKITLSLHCFLRACLYMYCTYTLYFLSMRVHNVTTQVLKLVMIKFIHSWIIGPYL